MRFKRRPMFSKSGSNREGTEAPASADQGNGQAAADASGDGRSGANDPGDEAATGNSDRYSEDEFSSEAPPEEASAGPAEPTAEEIAAEYLDQLQRLKAEFDNYRRRVLREREEWFTTARADVIRQLLPVLDDLRRARAHHEANAAEGDAAGLLLILKRFEDVLTQQGLKEQEVPPGTEFDPERHEAVIHAPSSEVPEGQIVQVVEPGYLLGNRLLRAGKVAVSSGPATE